MTIRYVPRQGGELPYWTADDPSMQDMEDMIFEIGARDWYNFVVVGVPCEISPQWLAKHQHIDEEYVGTDKRGRKQYRKLPDIKYEYAVSYSIWKEDIADMLDDNETVLDAFNYYLEGTGKCWREIEQLKLVDRRKPWENTM